MALDYKQAFALVALVCTFSISMANKDFGSWNYGYNYTGWPYKHHNATEDSSRKILVGGSENWRFGYNYDDWAWKNGPFYFNDTLVFKYDPPNGSFRHSVYLLRNYWSFLKCDLRRAKMVANVTQGAGEGFEFKLNRWYPHYFACGERDGVHCKSGMKFSVMPMIRWDYK